MKKMFEIRGEFARISMGGAIEKVHFMRLGNWQSGLSIAPSILLSSSITLYSQFLVRHVGNVRLVSAARLAAWTNALFGASWKAQRTGLMYSEQYSSTLNVLLRYNILVRGQTHVLVLL